MKKIHLLGLFSLGLIAAVHGLAQNKSQISVYSGGSWSNYVNTTSNPTLFSYNASMFSGRHFLTQSLGGVEYFKTYANISFSGVPASGSVYSPVGVSSGGISISSPIYTTLNAIGLNVNNYLFYNAGTASALSIDYGAAIYQVAGSGGKLVLFVYNRSNGVTVSGNRYFKLEDIYIN